MNIEQPGYLEIIIHFALGGNFIHAKFYYYISNFIKGNANIINTFITVVENGNP